MPRREAGVDWFVLIALVLVTGLTLAVIIAITVWP